MMASNREQVLWRTITAVAIGATLFTAVQGLSYPLLSIILDQRGLHEGFIGLNAAMMPLGMILAAPVAAALMYRIGGLALAVLSIVAAILCLLLIAAIANPWVWMPLRFLLGLWLACLFVVTDTWINQLPAEHMRGRVLGFYSMLTSIGFALGPGLLIVIGAEGWAPFLAGAVCGGLSLVPLFFSRHELPPAVIERRPSVLAFVAKAPILLCGATAAALADQVAMAMLPIFLLNHGMSVHESNVTLIFMIAGSIGIQYPIGWLADRLPRRALYVGCAVATALGAALLPIAVHTPFLLWGLVFLWGGAYYAIYTLSLILLGERFKGAALVTGSAAFAATWGVGGLVGTPLAGVAMQLIGPAGLPVTLCALFVLLTVIILLIREI